MLPLPPGPPSRFPILGNLKDLPTKGREWLKFRALNAAYNSDVVFLRVLGTPIVCISSLQAASDLLDRKGVVFSDRPRLPVLKDLTGWKWHLVLMSYHEGFTSHRKVVQAHLQPSVVTEKYRGIMIAEVHKLLSSLASRPADFMHLLKRMAGGIIMKVVYGHEISDGPDKFLDIANEVRTHGVKAPPGAAIVDAFPLLIHLPTWFPGASFKRMALSRRALARQMRDAPYYQVKEDMARGVSTASMVSTMIEDSFAGAGLDEELIKNCGGVLYSAGSDTTACALMNFVWAMMLHPSIQAKAQEELDRVVGRTRLPSFEDQDNLIYLNCILKETLRAYPITPLGVPHFSTKDVEYRGWHIPKNTTAIANIWAMLHDESVYKDPESFDPDRFMEPGSSSIDPMRVLYGFGRRICPGRFFANDSMFIAMASILHTFTISKPSGPDGLPLEQTIEWSSGIIRYIKFLYGGFMLSTRRTSMPLAFSCSLQARPLDSQLLE
ncbi:cytochrome P450 [Mycena capillaripes]|nr:cytochrome P450 [Mycena capillaripes]